MGSDLTKKKMHLCKKRFSARRRLPEGFSSDNRSNFLGARSDLMKIQKRLDGEQTEDLMSNIVSREGNVRVTISSRAPLFRGLWEAAVMQMKYHLTE